MVKNLKDKAISGMVWSSVHRFGTMIISFVANIVLARLLTPEDFGIIGMIMVFVAISNAFVDGGFASALIQKKKPTDEDYSTIFYWNLGISCLIFGGLYFAAPSIEEFYEMPSLAIYFRVVSLVLVINAFNIIQYNQLVKKLNFKRISYIYIGATVLGAGIGITMAYMGFGVWSLVVKVVALSFFQSIFFWTLSSWKPLLVFRLSSLKELFSFGSYILVTNIMIKLYDNIKVLIIGRVFSAEDLGYYTQAERMRSVPTQGLSNVVNQVTFPIFSQLQDDKDRLVKGLRKSLKAVTFINFPIMIIVIVIAKPLIVFLLTEKWNDSIIYLQILSAGGMVYTINTINNNIFKSLGKSRLYFIVLTIKRIVGLISILIGLNYGLTGLIIGVSVSNYISLIIGMYYSSTLTGYSMMEQLADVFEAFLLSVTTGLIIFYILSFVNGVLLSLIIGAGGYILIYIAMSYLFKLDAVYIYSDIIKSKIN